MKTFTKMTLLGAALALWPAMQISAQSFYYDDIYGSSTKKSTVKKQQRTVEKGYAPADTYTPTTYGSTRSVDEYNRRGNYKPVKQTVSADSLGADFTYTRRIEKFHNPDIVAEVNDPEVTYYYYNEEPEPATSTTINVFVDADPFWIPYYYPSAWSWAFTPGYYRPWSLNYWGPTWSWGWNWGPTWSWDWAWGWGGPSWSWGWGGGWNHDWGHPGWGHPGGWKPGPSWAGSHRPANGAWRPAARPGVGSNHAPNANRRPSGTMGSSSHNTRPSAGASAGTNAGASGNRSGNRGSWSRPYNPSDDTRATNKATNTNRGSGSSNMGTRSSGWNSGTRSSSSGTRSSSSGTRSSSSGSSWGGSSNSRSSSSGSMGTRSSGGSFGGGGGSRSSGGSSRGGRH